MTRCLDSLRKIYLFEWIGLVSFGGMLLFFALSPVRSEYTVATIGTMFLFSKISMISLVIMVFLQLARATFKKGSFREELKQSEIVQRRFWTDIIRIIVWFSLLETSHFMFKLYIPLLNRSNYDIFLHRVDCFFFAGTPPVVLLQKLFATPLSLYTMDLVYSSLYFLLLWGGVLVFFTFFRGDKRIRFFNSFAVMWQLGLILYILLPSFGPVFVQPELFESTHVYMPHTVYIQSDLWQETAAIMSGHYDITVRFFGLAAFPSLHVAVMFLFVLWSLRWNRFWLAWNSVFFILIVLGSILTGYHYLVDSPGGMAVALIAFGAGRGGRYRQAHPPEQVAENVPSVQS